jgi:hypothetical protein
VLVLVLVLVAAVEVAVAVGFERRRAGIWMHQSILPSVHYAQHTHSLPQFVVTSPDMYCLPWSEHPTTTTSCTPFPSIHSLLPLHS